MKKLSEAIKRSRCVLPCFLSAFLVLAGCASYKARFDENAEYFKRAESREQGPLKVSVLALSAQESRKTFGVNLSAKHILPLWIKIENHDPQHSYFFLERAVDPDYYTAGEAAFKSQFHVGYRLGKILPPFLIGPIKLMALPFENLITGAANRKMRDEFGARALKYGWVRPGEVRSGFMFIPSELGTKEVPIDLYPDSVTENGKTIPVSFNFFVQIPGLRMDYSDKEFDKYDKPEEIRNLQSEQELVAALESLPCCISSQKGLADGDPINLIMIGDTQDILTSFVTAKWDETEVIYWGSIWKMIRSFSFKKNYRYSPISPQYYEGRSQDMAFQKARATINERMHLRLWHSPLRYQGKAVWVGAVSRDIGVRFTTKAWNLMTHEIDPDLDESMLYVMSDLMYWNRIEKYAFIGGVPASTAEQPAYNMMGAPYFTSGKRVVLLVSKIRHPDFPDRIGVSPRGSGPLVE